VLSVLAYALIFGVLFFVKQGGIPLIYRTSNSYYLFGGDTQQRFVEFDISKKYDAIVLGSSHAYRGYDTRNFEKKGFNVYNLGSHGQSIFNTNTIVQNFVNKKNCKLAILDIYLGTVQSDGFESSADLIANISTDKAAFRIAKELEDIRSINMVVLRKLTHSFSKPFFEKENYISGGYVAKRDSVLKPINYKPFFKIYRPTEKNIEGLNNILSYLKKEGIKCIVVNHPAPKEIETSKYEVYEKQIGEIVDSYGFEFKNFSHDHNLHSQHHFYDYHHLNEAGARLYNESLINYLQQKSLLN